MPVCARKLARHKANVGNDDVFVLDNFLFLLLGYLTYSIYVYVCVHIHVYTHTLCLSKR